METNYFTGGGVGASIIVAIGLIYSAINHKRIRSNCCGRRVEASLDVENTTPTKIKIREPTTPKAKEETKSPA
jgi:hypothetical protein